MRRIMITMSATVMVLALASASALARHEHHHRDGRHHHRHARIERFGHSKDAPSASSSPGNAGTVKSFNDGTLTLLLHDGSTISGTVTSDTELECMAPEHSHHEDADRDEDGNGSGRTQSSGDHGSGEDQGDGADHNDNRGEDGNENEMEHSCSTSQLSSGTVVHEAELRLSSAGNVWKKVELES